MLSIASKNKLDLEELRSRQQHKEKKRLEIYDDVLKKCHGHILRSSESNVDNTFFRVPKFQLGKPPITNLKACIAYIIFNLKSNGLSVNFFQPDILWINWGESKPTASLPPAVAPVDFLSTQPIRHEDRVEARPTVKPKSKEEKLLQINKAVFRDMPAEQSNKPTVYDGDTLQSLKYFADRIKKR